MSEFEYSFNPKELRRTPPKGWTLQKIDNRYATTNGSKRTSWFLTRGEAILHAWVKEVVGD